MSLSVDKKSEGQPRAAFCAIWNRGASPSLDTALVMEEDDEVIQTLDSGSRKISDLSLSNFATSAKQSVSFPTYDEDEERRNLLSQQDRRDGPRTMGNLAESKLESTQPLAEGPAKHHTSNTATMMHLLKGNIGTGILAMPDAVSNAGLMVGSIGIPVLGVFCVHCMHLLVINSKKLAKKVGRTSLDYPSTMEQAFLLGPAPLRKFAPFMRQAVNTMLMITQFGFCCVYFLFVSKSIYEVVVSLNGSSPLSPRGYMALLLPIMIVFNFIRNLQSLSPASAIANILQVIGLVVVFINVIPAPYSKNLNVYTAALDRLPLYFGTAMYAFEGIGVVLPLENEMATPQDFGGFNGVLNTGMTVVASLYTAVGFYGYLKFGNNVQSSITFNLPKGTVSEIVRLMFALAIFLSYALQLYVPISMMWPWVREKFRLSRYSERKQRAIEYSFRAFLVFITFFFACVIPMLHLFISLVGAMASSSLALIFPPIIELVTVWNSNISRKMFICILIKDVFLIVFGLTGCVIGTTTAIREIVRCFRNPNDKSCEVN